MIISSTPIIYGLIFVAVLLLVEGIYLLVFGKSISLNNRVNRRLEMLEKGQRREQVLEQLRKEATQHANAKGIPLYSLLAEKAQKANIAFSPLALVGLMGLLSFLAFLGLTIGTQAAAPMRAVLALGLGVGGHLFLGLGQGEQAHQAGRRTTARCGGADGAQLARGAPLCLGGAGGGA